MNIAKKRAIYHLMSLFKEWNMQPFAILDNCRDQFIRLIEFRSYCLLKSQKENKISAISRMKLMYKWR
jgi:hypothetical protein